MNLGQNSQQKAKLTDEQFSQAISEKYQFVFNCCLRFTRRHTNPTDLAEDLAQQTMMNAYRSRATFNQQSNVMTWLFQIARFAYYDYLRMNRRRPWYYSVSLSETEECPSCKILTARTFQVIELQAQISRLPPTTQQVTELYRQGWKYSDIANKLNLPVGTVKSRVHRAKLAMSKPLG